MMWEDQGQKEGKQSDGSARKLKILTFTSLPRGGGI